MTPARLDLSIVRGITFGPVLIRCKDANGEAVSLSGWSAYAEVRKAPAQAVAFNLSPTITDAPGGEVTLTFTDEQTKTLPLGLFGWDLVLEKPTGERLGPYLAGTVTVSAINTQPV